MAGRIAISLRSIGVRASYVHGAEFHHGDFGVVGAGDVVILLSNSGKTAELVDAARVLKARGATVIGVTNSPSSPLAAASSIHIHAATTPDLLGSVPTRSLVVQEAVGNMLVQGVAAATGFTHADFIANHPGGAIGGKTAPV